MKKIVNDSLFGEIVYEEGFWTGKKAIAINGKPLTKIDKKTFKINLNDTNEKKETFVNVEGNYLMGVSLLIKDKTIEIYPKLKWYEIMLCIIPFILNLIWGNSVALCKIIPIVGGAIGGAISGIFTIAGLVFIKKANTIFMKLLAFLIVLVASFGVCAGIGYLILNLA